MDKKILLYSFFVLAFLIMFSITAFAQEEDVAAEELGVSESGYFSWFGDLVREVKIWVAQDPVKKSQLELEKASRELVKLRERAGEELSDQALEEELERRCQNYEEIITRINERAVSLGEEGKEQANAFLDKYAEHQIKHQQILKKLEEQVPEEPMETIRKNRERHLERFGEVMNRLQNKEEFKEMLKKGLENSAEPAVLRVRRMGIIEELKEASPQESIKEAIEEIKNEHKQMMEEIREQKRKIEEEQELKENQTSEGEEIPSSNQNASQQKKGFNVKAQEELKNMIEKLFPSQ